MSFHAAIALLILALAAPLYAQQSVVAHYRPQYPTPMSAEQKVDLLRHVAVDVHGGLLVKPDGSNCIGYACDVVCFSDAVLFDVLQDQDNAAIPQWTPTANPRNYHCEIVAASEPPPSSPPPPANPPPAPAPAPSVDLAPILSALTLQAAELAKIEAHQDQQDQTLADLAKRIDEPGWLTKVLSNRVVQMAGAVLVTWYTQHMVTK